MFKRIGTSVAGMLVVGLGAFLAIQGLDKADKWASVLGLFVGLAGLALAAATAIGARRHFVRQTVTDSTVGGVDQIHNVRGSVRFGPNHPSSPAIPAAPPGQQAGHGGGDQSVVRSSTTGTVRQVDDVGGDVEIDR